MWETITGLAEVVGFKTGGALPMTMVLMKLEPAGPIVTFGGIGGPGSTSLRGGPSVSLGPATSIVCGILLPFVRGAKSAGSSSTSGDCEKIGTDCGLGRPIAMISG